jgi:hypothetical protein
VAEELRVVAVEQQFDVELFGVVVVAVVVEDELSRQGLLEAP